MKKYIKQLVELLFNDIDDIIYQDDSDNLIGKKMIDKSIQWCIDNIIVTSRITSKKIKLNKYQIKLNKDGSISIVNNNSTFYLIINNSIPSYINLKSIKGYNVYFNGNDLYNFPDILNGELNISLYGNKLLLFNKLILCEIVNINNSESLIDLTGINEYMPKCKEITISYCDNFISTKGINNSILKITIDSCKSFTTFAGLLDTKNLYILIFNCDNLLSLIGLPKKMQYFYIDNSDKLKSLEGLSDYIDNVIIENDIEKLDCPNSTIGEFYISSIYLKSLKNGPKRIKYSYKVAEDLKSLDANKTKMDDKALFIINKIPMIGDEKIPKGNYVITMYNIQINVINGKIQYE